MSLGEICSFLQGNWAKIMVSNWATSKFCKKQQKKLKLNPRMTLFLTNITEVLAWAVHPKCLQGLNADRDARLLAGCEICLNGDFQLSPPWQAKPWGGFAAISSLVSKDWVEIPQT